MFAELCITSNFTFLTGASHPEEFVERAAALGLTALAICDENSVAGIVRAHSRIKEIEHQISERDELEARDGPIGPPAPPNLPTPPSPPIHAPIRHVPRLIPGARLVLTEGISLTVLTSTRAGWAALCRVISKGRQQAEKGRCQLTIADLPEEVSGWEVIFHPPQAPMEPRGAGEWVSLAQRVSRRLTGAQTKKSRLTGAQLKKSRLTGAQIKGSRLTGAQTKTNHPTSPQTTPNHPADAQATASPPKPPCGLHIALAPAYDGGDGERFAQTAALAERLGLPTIATAAPLMHHGRRRRLADVLTAIRLGRRVEELGHAAMANAEQRMRSGAEMRRLLQTHSTPHSPPHLDAIQRAADLAARCQFDIASLRYEYPSELTDQETPQQRLSRLAWDGLAWRYPEGIPDHAQRMLRHELTLIAKLKYEPYFLTVRDIVAFARERGILCQGRGSAANSITCYALGVTSVSPEIGTMVFERFVSEARDEPPDIDVDFEHERREEVIQHIYQRYGRHRAGLCATVIHYRGKRAIREVGAAMGLSRDTLAALSSQLWGFFSASGLEHERMREIGLDPTDRRLALTMELIHEIIGFPRHLSQHVGGFIITEGRLDELVPIENASMEGRTVICWDKDDIERLGILKVDVLSLGMLTCIRKAFTLLRQHHGLRYSLATLPAEDPKVYEMLSRADSLGVFQVESRAQMNFLPRMRPRCFYDLVIEVAIIRPGPIQGDMVHPYIRRRNGEEPVTFPSDALGDVLAKTLGVPLFQEQAMQIAIIGASFTPTEADRLRRSLATFKKHGNVSEFRNRFLKGMANNGYDQAFAERCFSQIEGFGSYGFPESHAASFALLVYASAWLKYHHPGIFACALLNAQPMGFYAPAQIVRDAREHGVTVRPIDINHSYWDNTMEPDGRGGLALRLGFRQIKRLSEDDAQWIAAARGNGYHSVRDVWRRAGLAPHLLARLAEADAFASLNLSRRDALWDAKALIKGTELPLFAGDIDGEAIHEPKANLPQMALGEEVVEDYVATRLSLRAHPVALLRHILTPQPGSKPPPHAKNSPQSKAQTRAALSHRTAAHPRNLASPLNRPHTQRPTPEP